MVRVVIIGGVAGGASAATRLRRLKEDFEIIIIEKGSYVSFANCGLPYYIGGDIKNRSALELVPIPRFPDRYNIDVRVNHEAISVDSKNRQIKIKNLKNKSEYYLSYDYLVLSPGAKPVLPDIPGINDIPVFTLRTIPDAVAIKEYVKNKIPKTAVVIGGGFIGLEIAENLQRNGVAVTIIEMLDQVMPIMDREMAQFIHQELILNGIYLILNDAVESFGTIKDNKPLVKTKSGRTIETDFIILSVGIRPDTGFLKDAQIDLNPRGHIIVNKNMQTSDPFIYAVGDAVQISNLQTNKPTTVALAGPASKQGRIAADNIAGRDSKYQGALGASVVKIFDITTAFVGLSEKDLKNSAIKYEKIYLFPNNHVRYYPNSVHMAFKLLFEVPTGKILGAQIVGGSGSEKRIDIISTLLKMGGTVFDLEELELSYSPPYSSAKDPVNMAGFIASNFLRGDMPIWHWHEMDEIKKKDVTLLDVRTDIEYKLRSFKGAINISDLKFRERMHELPKDKPIYVYCETGFRSYLVTRILLQNNFKEVYNLIGGFKIYEMGTITTEEVIENSEKSHRTITEIKDEIRGTKEDIVELDTSGLSLPAPLKLAISSLEALPKNKQLKVYATDPSFKSVIESYVTSEKNIKLLCIEKCSEKTIAILAKK